MLDPKEAEQILLGQLQDARQHLENLQPPAFATAEKPSIRRRVNVSTSVKGVTTAEATFEGTGLTWEEYQELSTEFFAWVEKNWPTPIALG